MSVGALVNLMSSSHPHFRSVLERGLWGFPLDVRGVNRSRWGLLNENTPLLLYFEHKGVKGVWMFGILIGKEESRSPVRYWNPPNGYPLRIHFSIKIPKEHTPIPQIPLDLSWLNNITPIRKEELVSAYGIRALKLKQDRWSLLVFGEERKRGITYPYSMFERIIHEFEARNLAKPVSLMDHESVKEVVYRIGQIQGRNPAKEYPIEDKRIDVVWRKTPRSVPYIVFEVSLKGDLYADLVKLKHAFDLWNAIPVLVTTKERAKEAMTWIHGTFHEVSPMFKILTIEKIRELYDTKLKMKKLESELGIL